MSHPITQKLLAIAICAIAFSTSSANAEQRSADACYEQKDQACLEEIFSDIVTNPDPEKSKAMYLLGVLQRDAGDFEGAKDTFMMSSVFGGGEEAQQALADLYDSGKVAFDDPSECLSLGSEACFTAIIENGQGESVRNAQYLLGGMLLDSEASRAAELLEAAHAAGHGTATCLLQELYLTGATGVQANYHKSVSIGLDCPFQPPFKRLNQDHFVKYEAEPGHKAYALAENGIAWYSRGIADPNVAARLAKEYCDTSPHRRSDDPECQVINLDGTWVNNLELSEIPDFTGGIEGLISISAQESYRDKYSAEAGIKVFVQSKDGSWSWRSSSQADATIESLTEQAMANCSSGWRSRLGYPCEVVNINGEWVE